MKKLVLACLLAGTTLMAADGAALYKKCASCHGQAGEKPALGKSKVIKGWAAADTARSFGRCGQAVTLGRQLVEPRLERLASRLGGGDACRGLLLAAVAAGCCCCCCGAAAASGIPR